MFCKNNIKYVEYLSNHAIFNISNTSMESLNRNIKMIYNHGRDYRNKDFFLIWLNILRYQKYIKLAELFYFKRIFNDIITFKF